MSLQTYEDIRQSYATRIGALSGWKEADVPWDLFGVDGVPDPVSKPRGHLSFAVGVPTSEVVSSDVLSRQRAQLLFQTTEVIVRFLVRLRAKNQRTAVDEGLAADIQLQQQLLQTAPGDGWATKVRLSRITRTSNSAGGWRLHEHRYLTEHTTGV